jgi:hypothetical protein
MTWWWNYNTVFPEPQPLLLCDSRTDAKRSGSLLMVLTTKAHCLLLHLMSLQLLPRLPAQKVFHSFPNWNHQVQTSLKELLHSTVGALLPKH